jgi:hypothetical protein
MKRIKTPAVLAGYYQFRLVIERLYEDAAQEYGYGTNRNVVSCRKSILPLIRKGLILPETAESQNPMGYTGQPTVKIELLEGGKVVDFLILSTTILDGFIGDKFYLWWIKCREEVGFFELNPNSRQEARRRQENKKDLQAMYRLEVRKVKEKLKKDIAFLRAKAKEEIEVLKEFY